MEMEKEPKPQAGKEEALEKPTRREFLKMLSGAAAGLHILGKNVEGLSPSPEEIIPTEQEWLRQVTVIPDAYRSTVVEAYRSLPPQLQIAAQGERNWGYF